MAGDVLDLPARFSIGSRFSTAGADLFPLAQIVDDSGDRRGGRRPPGSSAAARGGSLAVSVPTTSAKHPPPAAAAGRTDRQAGPPVPRRSSAASRRPHPRRSVSAGRVVPLLQPQQLDLQTEPVQNNCKCVPELPVVTLSSDVGDNRLEGGGIVGKGGLMHHPRLTLVNTRCPAGLFPHNLFSDALLSIFLR